MRTKKEIDKQIMQEDLKQIGINIKNFRKSYKNISDTSSEDINGLTQKQLAEQLNVSNNTISLIEQGKSLPSLPRILKICNVLKISLFDIFKDTSYVYTRVPKDIMDKYEQLNDSDKYVVNILIEGLYKKQKASEDKYKNIYKN